MLRWHEIAVCNRSRWVLHVLRPHRHGETLFRAPDSESIGADGTRLTTAAVAVEEVVITAPIVAVVLTIVVAVTVPAVETIVVTIVLAIDLVMRAIVAAVSATIGSVVVAGVAILVMFSQLRIVAMIRRLACRLILRVSLRLHVDELWRQGE